MSDKPFWYLSFVDPQRPIGQRFLGAVIVNASDFVDAVVVAHELGINPGGEVAGIEVPWQNAGRGAKSAGRLLSEEDLISEGIYTQDESDERARQIAALRAAEVAS